MVHTHFPKLYIPCRNLKIQQTLAGPTLHGANKKMDPYLINLHFSRPFPRNFKNFDSHCILPPHKNQLNFDFWCKKSLKLSWKMSKRGFLREGVHFFSHPVCFEWFAWCRTLENTCSKMLWENLSTMDVWFFSMCNFCIYSWLAIFSQISRLVFWSSLNNFYHFKKYIRTYIMLQDANKA